MVGMALKSLLSERIYSFPRGGILFEDPHAPPRNSCQTAFLPSLSVMPLVQHRGEKSYPVVREGDVVREGMLIARGQGAGSANIHAAVPGRVMRMVSYQNSSGDIIDAFVIRMEGAFEKLGKSGEVFPWEGMLSYDIQRVISDLGVVEMEGEGQPVSEIITAVRSRQGPLSLVVRCVFDDPYLAADYVLCKERAAAVAEGAVITARTCQVNRIIYAISYREKELGRELLSLGGRFGIPASVVLVGPKYPQRNRRELELVLRNYQKKAGLDLGELFILGPATAAAVYDAVKYRKPVLERYVSVGGSALNSPQVMRVRLGKRIGEIFAECGGFKVPPRRIATGSPLTGAPVRYQDEPVTKTTGAIFAFAENPRGEGPAACISCGECRTVCPVGLDPEELFKGINRAQGGDGSPGPCHGCGCCEVVCPSLLPLSSTIGARHRGEG
ncbi:MAG: 4Fe-4S dicluster domain-containing protein [Treponema sp.]|nr:4Fe-4S dicluster domain-containing protein [Treponema sp.]